MRPVPTREPPDSALGHKRKGRPVPLYFRSSLRIRRFAAETWHYSEANAAVKRVAYHRSRPHGAKGESLLQGAVNALHPYEPKHTKNRDKYPHQYNAERDNASIGSFAFDVRRHALQCNGARGEMGIISSRFASGPVWLFHPINRYRKHFSRKVLRA